MPLARKTTGFFAPAGRAGAQAVLSGNRLRLLQSGAEFFPR
jgi:hypothetical protein